MNRNSTVLMYVSLIYLFSVIACIGYLLIFPLRLVDFDGPIMEVGSKEIKPGDILPLRYPFTKYTEIIPEIHTRLINIDTGVGYPLPILYGNATRGRHDGWFYALTIPEEVPPGKYYLERRFVFNINFLQSKTVTLKTLEFKIIPDGLTLKQLKQKLSVVEEQLKKMVK